MSYFWPGGMREAIRRPSRREGRACWMNEFRFWNPRLNSKIKLLPELVWKVLALPPPAGWPAHFARPPKFQEADIIWNTFCKETNNIESSDSQTHQKYTFFQNILKSQNIDQMVSKWSIWDRFWMPFPASFSIKFHDLLTS